MIKINFFKMFTLESSISGLVLKVTSPKGIRVNTDQGYQYDLYEEICSSSKEESVLVQSGIYHVVAVHRLEDKIVWNHYLFQAVDDAVYPVAEFLDQDSLDWIPEAITYLKKAFTGKTLKQIKITKICKKDHLLSGPIVV